MITLHKAVPAFGVADISPFCLKVETYMRMVGLQYRGVVSDSRKAPKRKIPWIEDDGRIVSDSTAIVTYLEDRVGSPLDANLRPRDHALTVAFRALLEEHFYFVVLWMRWCDNVGWHVYRPVLLSIAPHLRIPKVVAPLVLAGIRRQYMRSVWIQGTGRHTPDEINALGQSHLTAVSECLGDQLYFLGEQPRTIDSTVYAFLAAVVFAPFEGPIKDHASHLPNLMSYCERIRAQYWSDTPSNS